MRLIKTVAWAFALTAFIGAGKEMQGLAAYGSPPTSALQAGAAAPEPAAVTGELVRHGRRHLRFGQHIRKVLLD